MLVDIQGFEGYQINEKGDVFSVKRGRYLVGKIDGYGYRIYGLSVGGKTYHRAAHRLVAITYIDNPHNFPCVNHINENKLDNRVENLEWCTAKYNANHGSRNERITQTKCKKPVIQTLPNGNEIRYKGVKDAWRKTGIAWSQIAKACNGVIKTAHGTKWRYADDSFKMA